jgi:tol-pal system protein YbgF
MKNKINFLILFCLYFFYSILPANAQQAVAYNERIEHQEIEMRRLVGEIERLKFENKQFKIQIAGLRKEIELRFKSLENQPPKAEPPKNAIAPVANDVSEIINNNKQQETVENNSNLNNVSTPIEQPNVSNEQLKTTEEYLKIQQKNPLIAKDLYQKGQDYLKNKDYIKAEQNFNDIITKYPDHLLVSNAYYWLGETYYARKDYNKAALTFLEGKKRFPNSNKASHNLIKLGLSLYYLNQAQQACVTFQEVEQKYLLNDKSIEKTLRSSQKTAGCFSI